MHGSGISVSELQDDSITLRGTLHYGNLSELIEDVVRNPLPLSMELTLELEQFEIEDSLATLTFASLLCALARRISMLRLSHAPQNLIDHLEQTGHTTGDFPIHLVNAREPEQNTETV